MGQRTKERATRKYNIIWFGAVGTLLSIIIGLPIVVTAFVTTDHFILVSLTLRLFFLFLLPGLIGIAMGSVRSIGPRAGFLIGLFLSYFGLVIMLFFPAIGHRVQCPHCDERISAAANVCKHCRRSVVLEPEFDD